jgi:sugar phosphate isomerase/epimerase
MRYAICNETFQDWDWARTCHQVAELGYDAIEIAPFTLAPDVRAISAHSRKVYADTARHAGLDVVGLHWLLVSPQGLSITSDDASIRKYTSEYLEALVDFCADMGGKVMVLGSPAQRRLPSRNRSDGIAPETLAVDRLEACLEPAIDRAQAHHMVICLEPLPPPESDFILTLQEALTLVKRFNHPSVRTIFDVKSASSEGAPLPDLIRKFAADIAHVHANDSNRRGPGFGGTDFVPILSTLQEVGYQGYVSVEVFDYTPDPITIARQSLAYMQRCQNATSIR